MQSVCAAVLRRRLPHHPPHVLAAWWRHGNSAGGGLAAAAAAAAAAGPAAAAGGSAAGGGGGGAAQQQQPQPRLHHLSASVIAQGRAAALRHVGARAHASCALLEVHRHTIVIVVVVVVFGESTASKYICLLLIVRIARAMRRTAPGLLRVNARERGQCLSRRGTHEGAPRHRDDPVSSSLVPALSAAEPRSPHG